jgi:hypothetical protein
MIIVAIVLAIGALAGAWFGWIIGTSELRRPHLDPLAPVFRDSPHGDRIHRRRQIMRIVLTLLGIIAGAAASLAFLFWLARR